MPIFVPIVAGLGRDPARCGLAGRLREKVSWW